jgi:hypothetical protein
MTPSSPAAAAPPASPAAEAASDASPATSSPSPVWRRRLDRLETAARSRWQGTRAERLTVRLTGHVTTHLDRQASALSRRLPALTQTLAERVDHALDRVGLVRKARPTEASAASAPEGPEPSSDRAV